MAWALVVDNVVANVVVSDTGDGYTAIPDTVGIGWALVGGVWTAPTPAAQPKLITAYAFWQRFTPAERVAIRASADPLVADLVALLSIVPAYDNVDLGDANITVGVSYLAAAGLITLERVAEILA